MTPPHDAHRERAVSPTLGKVGDAEQGGYEIKFLLDETAALRVQEWASVHGEMSLDPHASPDDGAYQITTLYLDTPTLAVYHRTGELKRDKFRVRRYGTSQHVFVERKHKKGDRVNKERSIIEIDQVAALAERLSLASWSGHWFHELVHKHDLRPGARITYRRTALMGASDDGPIRLTLDRQIAGVLTEVWGVGNVVAGINLLPARVVMEIKFARVMPGVLKRMMGELALMPCGVSKYRSCRDAWGVPASPAQHGKAERA